MASPTIFFPDDITHETPVGGKARNLWFLCELGFQVPDWFVVIGETDEEAIRTAVKQLGGASFAVRSSAIEEDSSEHSFAGQFDSFLFVELEDICEKIREVLDSAKSERIRIYKETKGIETAIIPPSVIIQKMIDAEIAGVAFSANPVSGKRSEVLVSAVHGVGEALVSGESDADTITLDQHGSIVGRVVANKTSAISDKQAQAVARLAVDCQEEFGVHQDIEWAIKNDEVFLLQSRPITSLENFPDPDGPLNIWDNSNIAESYSGVTTALTFSFALRIYESVYREFCQLLHVPKSRIIANEQVFANMLGSIRGRVYYNLINWYRVLSYLPGFRFNRSFMEQMMGVKEPMPSEVVEEIEKEISDRGKLRDLLELIRSVFGLVRSHFLLNRQICSFYSRLELALAEPEIPLARMRSDQLIAHYRELESSLLKKWDAPLVNDFFAMIFFGVLTKLCKSWCGDEDGTLQNKLIAGGGDIISTEPIARIRELASLARGRPEIIESLKSGEKCDGFGEFSEKLQAYLDKFGDRCLEELKLESPTLLDSPDSLFFAILATAERGKSKNAEVCPNEKAEMPDLPFFKKLVFRRVLKTARNRVRDRENLRFERTRLFGRVRRVFVELGKRFHADGVIASPRDIFNLEINEIFGFCDGTVGNIRELARARRVEFALYQGEDSPPDRFETRGAPGLYLEFASTRKVIAPEGDHLKGLGCCAGIVRGRARVIRDPRKANLEHGDILVAQQTDPGWVMLFPAAAGVLVERGSLLSHSAIVSREMGIPSVVSISGLLDWVEDGEILELDGKAGTIRKVAGDEQ